MNKNDKFVLQTQLKERVKGHNSYKIEDVEDVQDYTATGISNSLV